MKPTQQQIIAYKLRLIGGLADSLALSSASAVRKGLRLIADTAFDSASEIRNLEPEESDIDEVLARIETRRSVSALSRF